MHSILPVLLCRPPSNSRLLVQVTFESYCSQLFPAVCLRNICRPLHSMVRSIYIKPSDQAQISPDIYCAPIDEIEDTMFKKTTTTSPGFAKSKLSRRFLGLLKQAITTVMIDWLTAEGHAQHSLSYYHFRAKSALMCLNPWRLHILIHANNAGTNKKKKMQVTFTGLLEKVRTMWLLDTTRTNTIDYKRKHSR